MMRRATQICVATLLAACLGSRVSADTFVPGGNFVGANVWTPAGSPYIVAGDLTLPANTSLQIQPGVSVRVVSGDALASGLDPSRVELRVAGSGTLQVLGTPGAPVTFRAHVGTAANTWYGIVAEPGAVVTLQSAVVEHANQALRASVLATITDSTFANNNVDIALVAGAPSPTLFGTLTAGSFVGSVIVPFGATLSLNRVASSIQAGSLTLSGTLRPSLTSILNYEKLSVAGSVTLGASALELDAFGGSIDDVFVLIDNDGAEPVSGTFIGLPEGEQFVFGTYRLRVSYTGGTGNDVTLRVSAEQVPVFPALRAE